MATGPLNLKGKLHEQDAYLVSEQRHQDGSPVIVAVVANPQYRAMFKAAPAMLAALEMAVEKLITQDALRLWNESENAITTDEARSMSERNPPELVRVLRHEISKAKGQ